jgi:hypothetical protein
VQQSKATSTALSSEKEDRALFFFLGMGFGEGEGGNNVEALEDLGRGESRWRKSVAQEPSEKPR